MTTGWKDYAAHRSGAPHAISGEVLVMPDVESSELGNRRDIIVYLPPSYGSGAARYPVFYMQDGQNLFDPHTSYAGEWGVDEAMERLAEHGTEAIVVGVPNAGVERLDEYSPWRDPRFGGGRAEAYLRFLATAVRGLVETSFRVERASASTAVMGSSMGGLFSLWAFFEIPEWFGLCAAFSPSVQFAQGALLHDLARRRAHGGRIHLDAGTHEGSPGRLGKWLFGLPPRPYLRAVRSLRRRLEEAGFRAGVDLQYLEEMGGEHNEAAWGRRFPDAVRFLLGEGETDSLRS